MTALKPPRKLVAVLLLFPLAALDAAENARDREHAAGTPLNLAGLMLPAPRTGGFPIHFFAATADVPFSNRKDLKSTQVMVIPLAPASIKR